MLPQQQDLHGWLSRLAGSLGLDCPLLLACPLLPAAAAAGSYLPAAGAAALGLVASSTRNTMDLQTQIQMTQDLHLTAEPRLLSPLLAPHPVAQPTLAPGLHT
jgi:hypothetical protein